ncbi:MAG TPA: DUF4333 domain-containing protein [Plantibacter sp.]|uniref:DUF4333 domain-containing protein n=1 Tax=unclassified Plantibacter TaxID=2624265 RepID=UPI002B877BC3|nr:DUF4333 domain-containing protein [Plantibacter sp.]
MTDEKTPDQQPPEIPEQDPPRAEFGPGNAQRDAHAPTGAPPQAQRPTGASVQQDGSGGHTGPSFPTNTQGQPWLQPNRSAGPAPQGAPQSMPNQPQPPYGQGTPFRPQPPYGIQPANQQPSNQQPSNQQPYGQRPHGPGQQQFAPGPQQPANGPFAPNQQQPGQPGAPFRPGAEYGNTGQQQPFPAASMAKPKAKRKPLGRRLWAGVLIGAVAASLIAVPLTLLSVGRLFTPMLDRGAVQTGVAEVLKQDFGLADVEKVECPGDQAAVTGTQFECTFSYGGTSYPVAVEVINDQGQYRVGIDAPKQ